MQAGTGFFHEAVAEINNLGEVMPGIDVEELERNRGRSEGAAGQLEDNDGVLASRKEDAYLVELAGHLTQDVNGLVFKVFEVWGKCAHYSCNPHSVLPSANTRPDRASSPSPTGKVSGAQPMERYPCRVSGWMMRSLSSI